MGTPKKTAKKKPVSRITGAKKSAEEPIDPKVKKKIIDDDEDEDFDLPLEDDLGYENFEGFDEDDEY